MTTPARRGPGGFQPMTEREVRAVLAKAMAIDNRKRPSEATVEAWVEIAQSCRWTLEEALDAVREHYASSSAWIMPGHVTTIIRRHRSQPRAPLALDAAPPAHPRAVHAQMRRIAARQGWDLSEEPVGPLRFGCQRCFACPRQPCTDWVRSGRQRGKRIPLEDFHAERITLASASGWTP